MKRLVLVVLLCLCSLTAFPQLQYIQNIKQAYGQATNQVKKFLSLKPTQKPAPSRTAKAQPAQPQLHVIYVEEQSELEYARVNLVNDSLLSPILNTIATDLNYKLQNWRLLREDFTRQTLKKTIDSLQTSPWDIIIVYFSGYGIPSADPTTKLANWRLDDVRERGLAVRELETWLKGQKAHLSLLLADYQAEVTTEKPKRLPYVTRVYSTLVREALAQLFIKNSGVIKFGSTLNPKHIVADGTLTGTLFTSAFCRALIDLINPTSPSELLAISFKRIQAYTDQKMGTGETKTILEENLLTRAPSPPSDTLLGIQAQQRKLTGAQWQGLRTNEQEYNNLLQKRLVSNPLPNKIDLSKYTPPVIDQDSKGVCVAVAIGYYMRSTMEAIKLNLTDKTKILQHSFSPAYLYRQVKDQMDDNCTSGLYPEAALEFCKNYGLVSYSGYPNLTDCEPADLNPRHYTNSKIFDYVKLFSTTDIEYDKIQATKQALSERAPVVVGIQLTPSMGNLSFSRLFFTKFKNSVTQLVSSDTASTTSQWDPAQSNTLDFGHAMCVVGYDDKVLGGAFKLVNSWGKSWGDDGFFWITYDNFARFAKYGYQAYLPPQPGSLVLSADVSLHHTLTPDIPLAVRPFEYGNGNSLTGYSINKPLKTGTLLKLAVKATTQSYLYVLAANSKDSTISSLFPSVNYSPLVLANTVINVTRDSLLAIMGNPSTEYLLLIFSNQKIDNLDEIRNQLQTQQGTFPERVAASISGVIGLVQRNKLTFKKKKTGFFCYPVPLRGNRPYIVPVLMAINHVNK